MSSSQHYRYRPQQPERTHAILAQHAQYEMWPQAIASNQHNCLSLFDGLVWSCMLLQDRVDGYMEDTGQAGVFTSVFGGVERRTIFGVKKEVLSKGTEISAQVSFQDPSNANGPAYGNPSQREWGSVRY